MFIIAYFLIEFKRNILLLFFKENCDANSKLHPDLDIKISEVILLLLSYYTRHNLTNVALINLLQLINLILGVKCIPETYFKFMKLCKTVGEESFDYTKQYYCQNCKIFLGSEFNVKICSNCTQKKVKYFVTTNIVQQIKDIIIKNFMAITEFKKRIKNDNLINDISKANFVTEAQDKEFTISFNLDGIATFKSNIKKSLWPIIVTINDLPPRLRFLNKNCIIAGLWLDNGDPVMDIFLKPFCESMKILNKIGVLIHNKICKIKCVCCCADSVARCKILNFKQFNGYFGCTYCKQSPESVPVKSGRQLRYTFKELSELRSLTDHLELMREAHVSKKSIFGVKGLSPLICIPDFDFTKCLPVDYMHAIMLGLVKTVTDLWLDSKNNNKPYYIGRKLNQINERILSIKPFTEMSQYPRDIHCRALWKSHEWENWLLYFMSSCLLGI